MAISRRRLVTTTGAAVAAAGFGTFAGAGTARAASGGPAWLKDAVFYQIYPQSFADSDGDGIGDLAGITEHLDHLQWLGVNTVWINPCFVSPFGDAGYDVADYTKVADRYGDNDTLVELIDAARGRGLRVLLDLVAGHTSDQHSWFGESLHDDGDHRYIWSEAEPPPDGFVRSPGPREGSYLPNYYDFQPALNFGYARMDSAEPWRQPVDAEWPRANRAELRTIMDYWLRRGASGFRVDMAASLVKDDPGKRETAKLWREMREWLDRRHPQAMIMSEWGDPEVSVPAGFHADFFLPFDPVLGSLWDNGTGTSAGEGEEHRCYFDPEGRGSAAEFVRTWRKTADNIGDAGHVSLPTASHDFSRLACGPRTREQLPAAFAFQLTWPTLPVIYYGDEIGMRYVPHLPDREGSKKRSGSRTPMQWERGENAGFSTAPADRLYFPVDPDDDRPDVASQRADPDSLLHLVRRLVAMRKSAPELGSSGSVEVLHDDGYPLVYVRGGRYLVVVNPRREPAATSLPKGAARGRDPRPVERAGVTVHGGVIAAGGFGYGVFEL